MEILQEIIVFIIFSIAVGYMVFKFVWMPPFLKRQKKDKACGVSDCGCH